ncbi:zinc-ribbon domain-containing protein [Pseudobutyrivibrio sp. OR37]|uniref:chitobiase/beta-hexosaminidase C-terminal domain-containing protein n=1 Tax=Pseudobutyrivibrio sp. OR37 TaxID=1798186 RepID=UPI0008E4ED7D|nr:chitobiase/beta-hexosaminidase C-terminal domain-containing protein [Pseudobutyrivibrio sp. OR37]SFH61222.1 zinc-ribbon domain-containing protein [Pseudobutyrivibrio sp. OR37]
MNCKKCGAEIENGLMYCPKCGESIQLVPDYNVLEEELLSKVVEDKNKSKDDKFATGVYKYTEKPEVKEKPIAPKTIPSEESQVFTKKIKTLIFIAFILIAIIGAFMIIPYVGSHSYDNIMNKAVDAENNTEYAKALGYYEEAFEINSTSFEVIYGLGRMYYRVKDYENAVLYLEKALESDPNNKNIYTYLLDSLSILGDTDSIYELAQNATDEEIKTLISGYILLPPAFSYEAGEYDKDFLLQLTTTGDYQIFYTVNGKNPTTSGKLYSKPIQITEGTTEVKAVAQNEVGEYSEVASAKYVVTHKQLSLPVVSPTDGVYTEKVMISIDVPEGCKAYYTWDGTNPVQNGIEYMEPFPIIEGTSVLSVVIVDEDGNVSPTYHGNYIYQS